MAVINQQLADIVTRYQVYLERYKAHTVKKFDGTLVLLDAELRKALLAYGSGQLSSLSKRQVTTLINDLTKRTTKLTDAYVVELMSDLKDINAYSKDWEHGFVNRVTTSGTVVAQATADAAWKLAQEQPIQAIGQLLQPWVDRWQAGVAGKVEAAVRNGYAQGQTVQQVVQALRGTKAAKYKDGILSGATRRETEALVRTTIQHTAAMGREAVYDANDDIIEGYQWISTLDSRTTQQCRSLDGRVFKRGQGPLPPIHVNCRSTTIPMIKGVNLADGITRASKGADGGDQVPASKTYYGWLKDQPKWFQDDALGVERAQLFRNGGLSADKFSQLNLDRNFQPLTLDEMRKKAPQAFEKAGL